MQARVEAADCRRRRRGERQVETWVAVALLAADVVVAAAAAAAVAAATAADSAVSSLLLRRSHLLSQRLAMCRPTRAGACLHGTSAPYMIRLPLCLCTRASARPQWSPQEQRIRIAGGKTSSACVCAE